MYFSLIERLSIKQWVCDVLIGSEHLAKAKKIVILSKSVHRAF